jgi:hypothetical protein
MVFQHLFPPGIAPPAILHFAATEGSALLRAGTIGGVGGHGDSTLNGLFYSFK